MRTPSGSKRDKVRRESGIRHQRKEDQTKGRETQVLNLSVGPQNGWSPLRSSQVRRRRQGTNLGKDRIRGPSET